MKRSEIFENFVKIAQEKGLISEGTHAEHTEKDFPETNPRHDSLSIEQIGKLYGVKPSKPEGMEYNRNIVEDAHPESLVISPSHDKLNGLVENINERQNILLRIVHKEPDGHLTQRKYARKQLLLSLVRVGNKLDNDGHEELRKLADVCLAQASEKPLKKKAFWGVALGVAGALLAAVWAQQHLRMHSDGFTRDYEKTVDEINDLLNSNTNWGVGYSYTPQFIQTVNQLKDLLAELNTEVQKILPVLEELEKPRMDLSEIKNDEEALKRKVSELVQQPNIQEGVRAIEGFKHEIDKVYPFLYKIMLDFDNEGYKQRAIVEKGVVTQLIDWPEFLHGGKGLVADDFDDVKRALQTLMLDISNLVKELRGYASVKQQFIQDMQGSQSEEAKMFAEPEPAAPTTKVPETARPGTPATEIGALEGEGEGLLGGLFGR